MVRYVERWVCEICNAGYPTEAGARACEVKRANPSYKVGDVIRHGSFGWANGAKSWIANPECDLDRSKHDDGRNCFRSCCCLEFFYVCTAIDGDSNDPHRLRYHFFTKAMRPMTDEVLGSVGHGCGYTFSTGHKKPEPLDPKDAPGHILRAAKRMKGKKAGRLLS